MTLPDGFSMDFVSDPRYEYLAAEISLQRQRLFMVSRQGEQIDLEFFLEPRVPAGHREIKVSFEDFLRAVEIAKHELMSLQSPN